MPRNIESLSARKGRPASYDWDTFLDGTARAFVQGVKDEETGQVLVEGDFYCIPKSFESQARKAAGDKGDLSVAVRHVDPEVVNGHTLAVVELEATAKVDEPAE